MLIEDFEVSKFQILVAKAKTFNISPFSVENYCFDEVLFKDINKELCSKLKILPVGSIGDCLIVAVANPFQHIKKHIAKETSKHVYTLLAFEDDIKRYLESDNEEFLKDDEYQDVVDEIDVDFDLEAELGDEDEYESEDSAPVIRLATRIIEDAYYCGGSDIHIEPMESGCRVRVRIDGLCQEKLTLPPKVSSALVARYKIMANLDIAESDACLRMAGLCLASSRVRKSISTYGFLRRRSITERVS